MGKDISCNLGSLNIAAAMDSADFGKTVETAIRTLTAVSDMSHIPSVPSIEKGNDDSHAIGLGQMNLHGYLARERIYYGSEEGVDFTNIYFYTVIYTDRAVKPTAEAFLTGALFKDNAFKPQDEFLIVFDVPVGFQKDIIVPFDPTGCGMSVVWS